MKFQLENSRWKFQSIIREIEFEFIFSVCWKLQKGEEKAKITREIPYQNISDWTLRCCCDFCLFFFPTSSSSSASILRNLIELSENSFSFLWKENFLFISDSFDSTCNATKQQQQQRRRHSLNSFCKAICGTQKFQKFWIHLMNSVDELFFQLEIICMNFIFLHTRHFRCRKVCSCWAQNTEKVSSPRKMKRSTNTLLEISKWSEKKRREKIISERLVSSRNALLR